jgi:hypothetical protein
MGRCAGADAPSFWASRLPEPAGDCAVVIRPRPAPIRNAANRSGRLDVEQCRSVGSSVVIFAEVLGERRFVEMFGSGTDCVLEGVCGCGDGLVDSNRLELRL